MTRDNEFWKRLYKEMLIQYSWGMPKNVKSEFKKRIEN